MQRLSALESKFQQTIRERDSLRKNLEHLKVEAATRMSSQEIFTLSAEKDEIIKELREEGEKLSKQQLQHSNIIKKLRAKEKENDALVKSQKYVSSRGYFNFRVSDTYSAALLQGANRGTNLGIRAFKEIVACKGRG